jgi:hypothetical protein
MRLAGSGYLKQSQKLGSVLILDNVGQSVFVEHFQKSLQSFTKHRFQTTNRRYLAGILGGKALHDAQILFGFPNQNTDTDVRRGTVQAHAAFLAPDSFNVSLLVQLMHHLHKVVLGNVVAIGDFLNGGQTITLNCQIYQYSK